jgi:hypothetical protein
MKRVKFQIKGSKQTVTVSFVAPLDLVNGIRKLSEKNQRTFSAEIRVALLAHLNQAAPDWKPGGGNQ